MIYRKVSEIAQKEILGRMIIVYGTVNAPLFLIHDIEKWLDEEEGVVYACFDKLDHADQIAVSITQDQGTFRYWAVTEHGMCNILNHLKVPFGSKLRHQIVAFLHELQQNTENNAVSVPKQKNSTEQLYSVQEIINNPDALIQILEQLKTERARNVQLNLLAEDQKQQIAELKPKAEYYDTILNCDDGIPVSVIAKDYGKSGSWLNKKLKDLQIQFRQSGIWLLYQEYADKGYTFTRTLHYTDDNGEVHAKLHTYWTQTGRKFIFDTLSKHGIVPNALSSEKIRETDIVSIKSS